MVISLLLESYTPTMKDYLFSVLLGEVEVFKRILPLENTVKMADIEKIQMYAGSYNKLEILQYVNEIIKFRCDDTEDIEAEMEIQ